MLYFSADELKVWPKRMRALYDKLIVTQFQTGTRNVTDWESLDLGYICLSGQAHS